MTRGSFARAACGRLSVLLAVAALAGACHARAALPSCVAPPPGVGPDATATLGNADNGKTVCLKSGDVLTIFLRAGLSEQSWSRIAASGDEVLEARSTGVMTLPRGVTGAIFAAHGTGVAELRSTRRECALGRCSDQGWSARIVVRKR